MLPWLIPALVLVLFPSILAYYALGHGYGVADVAGMFISWCPAYMAWLVVFLYPTFKRSWRERQQRRDSGHIAADQGLSRHPRNIITLGVPRRRVRTRVQDDSSTGTIDSPPVVTVESSSELVPSLVQQSESITDASA